MFLHSPAGMPHHPSTVTDVWPPVEVPGLSFRAYAIATFTSSTDVSLHIRSAAMAGLLSATTAVASPTTTIHVIAASRLAIVSPLSKHPLPRIILRNMGLTTLSEYHRCDPSGSLSRIPVHDSIVAMDVPTLL